MQIATLSSQLNAVHMCLNWMRTSILSYAEVAARLLGLLEECYAEVGWRTKKKLRQLS
jgi:hypothetical protein